MVEVSISSTHWAVPDGLFMTWLSKERHNFPFWLRIGRFWICINRTFDTSKPQYSFPLRKFYTNPLFSELQANIKGISQISVSLIPIFLLILSRNSSRIVLFDFSSSGYINLFWKRNRLDEPAHNSIIPAYLLENKSRPNFMYYLRFEEGTL